MIRYYQKYFFVDWIAKLLAVRGSISVIGDLSQIEIKLQNRSAKFSWYEWFLMLFNQWTLLFYQNEEEVFLYLISNTRQYAS